MKITLRSVLGVLLPALLAGPAMACYTVYNSANKVIYNAAQAPVDMRYQLHQTLPARFPGYSHMVFSLADSNCPAIDSRAGNNVARTVNALPAQVSYVPGPDTK